MYCPRQMLSVDAQSQSWDGGHESLGHEKKGKYVVELGNQQRGKCRGLLE
jgi:hypothetical protein